MYNPVIPIPMYEDNLSCINLIRNFENNKRNKHLNVRYHFIKDMENKNKIKIYHVNSMLQKADCLTKSIKSKI